LSFGSCWHRMVPACFLGERVTFPVTGLMTGAQRLLLLAVQALVARYRARGRD